MYLQVAHMAQVSIIRYPFLKTRSHQFIFSINHNHGILTNYSQTIITYYENMSFRRVHLTRAGDNRTMLSPSLLTRHCFLSPRWSHSHRQTRRVASYCYVVPVGRTCFLYLDKDIKKGKIECNSVIFT